MATAATCAGAGAPPTRGQMDPDADRATGPKPVRGNASSRDPDPLRDLQVEEGDDDVLAERVAIDHESHDPPAVSSLDPGSNSANIRASKAKLTKLFVFTSLGAVGGMVALMLSLFYGIRVCLRRIKEGHQNKRFQLHMRTRPSETPEA